jgi:hypothetical protein
MGAKDSRNDFLGWYIEIFPFLLIKKKSCYSLNLMVCFLANVEPFF